MIKDKFDETYKNVFSDEQEQDQDLATNELDVTDPIDEIIEEVGEKYKKTWKELAK